MSSGLMRWILLPHILPGTGSRSALPWDGRATRPTASGAPTLRSSRPCTRPQEIILLGAHYDTVRGTPGADDNASGVAALLEISAMLKATTHAYTVRCVAFVNEEAPFFFRADMGSLRYARAARRRDDRIRLMVSLEMLGYYRSE